MTFGVGVLTLGEITSDPATGRLPSALQRMRDTVEQAVLAEQVGLDVFGVGEHHRGDFIASSPAVVLSAIAARTSSIRLTSAVTVLSSLDPVRVFQDFATLDLVSGGRAEIIAGRGPATDSFPLFGLHLEDHAALFAEKLDLLVSLREEDPITWFGRFRTPLHEADVAPRPVQERLPVYVGVDGTPSSAARAGRMGLPLAHGVLFGRIDSALGVHEAYVQAATEAGHDPARLRRTVAAHGFVAATSQQARATTYAHLAHGMRENGPVRGGSGAPGSDVGRSWFDHQASAAGALMVGSPQQVVDKAVHQHELYGHDRLLLHLGAGGVPQREVLRAIELLGTEVAPVLRREIPVLAPLGV
ncbi:LLM class flavin-dependent oxidoreductase [Modestobacter sp. L9-4]|uniref:LLM class flavin-dependent oxidoreductase n=1 Tax=Modestobacter sp. L9-4 TaxID=2851567 RepID=UPI001C78D249|nr:LLM class flavin-dependent oxidoreductase [Modestobacter sp. L9-4]QXG76065.1 LLM class flavin-dependent oxidoreductase [Modestobacter sp. L9-4]